MIEAIFSSENYDAAKRLLDVSVRRHEAIASNLANIETPGYQRVEVAPKFIESLQEAIRTQELKSLPHEAPMIVEDQQAVAVRPDGNTVSLESELMGMNRNALEYQYLSEMVSSNLKRLKMAITGRGT